MLSPQNERFWVEHLRPGFPFKVRVVEASSVDFIVLIAGVPFRVAQRRLAAPDDRRVQWGETVDVVQRGGKLVLVK